MITVAALELRRIFRRRISLLLLALPLVLVLSGLVVALFGQRLPAVWIWMLIPVSSLVVYGQAILSDREGRLDLTLTTSRVSRRFPLYRQIVLFLVPLAFQITLFRILNTLVGNPI